MPKLAFAIRVVLFIVKLGRPRVHKTLPQQRRITFLFMRLMNRLAGVRTPGFYSIVNTAFTAAAGHTVKLKIFTPVKQTQPLPVWVYLHGGGFALGSYAARPNFAKAIAAGANCIVVAVQYRLAPEHPFPAGLTDCYEAVNWIASNAHTFGGDGARIAVGGESAGGNLATAVCMMARDRGTPAILHQTLLYPVVEMAMQRPSITKYAEGYLLTMALMKQFHAAYIANAADKENPYASPLLGNLSGLPPALVITAEYDPLVDEGELYAQKLKDSGVPTVHKLYKGMIHDFTLTLGTWLPEGRESIELVVTEVRKALHAPVPASAQ